MRRALLAASALCVAALLVAGCGGGSSSSSAAAAKQPAKKSAISETTRPEWTNQADAICRAAHEANGPRVEEFLKVVAGGLKTPAARAEAADLVREGVRTIRGELHSFDVLIPPAPLDRQAGELMEDLETAITLENEVANALERGNVRRLDNLGSEVVANEITLRGLALHLGLRVCGKLFQLGGNHSLA